MSAIIDQSNTIYFSGEFEDTLRIETQQIVSQGKKDALIVGVNQNLTPVFINSIGGGAPDWARGIALNSRGEILATAVVQDTFYCTIADKNQFFTSKGKYDIAYMYLNKAGKCTKMKLLGGKNEDGVNKIITDGLGNLYLTGWCSDTAFFDEKLNVRRKARLR